MRRLVIGIVLSAAMLAACHPQPAVHSDATGPGSSSVTSTCVHGWSTPGPTSPEIAKAVHVIRVTLGVKAPLQVVADRFFTGPESPPSEDKGYLAVIDRWYVKAREQGHPSVGGRFLVEGRQFGIGLVAAAPFATSGFSSDDWVGFQYAPGGARTSVDGIPGTLEGVTYDFVNGGGGLEFPGLPDQLSSCMDGT